MIRVDPQHSFLRIFDSCNHPSKHMKRILITGANGFVGSHLVDGALQKGWDVWAGIRTGSRLDNLTDPAIHYIKLDYDKPERLQRQFAQAGRWDYVVHCAGLTKALSYADFDRVNHQHTRTLVEALIKADRTPDKFLLMSSLDAIGAGNPNKPEPTTNDANPHPCSNYGRSKLAAEQYLAGFEDFPWLIVRPTGIYGPRDNDFRLMARMVNRGLALSLGRKPQWLNFLYVEDLVTVCLEALCSPHVKKAWMVAHPDIHTQDDFIQLLKNLLGKKSVFNLRVPLWIAWLAAQLALLQRRLTGTVPLFNPDKFRIVQQRNWTCDVTALQQDLGITPSTNLREGWIRTLKWYQSEHLL